MCGSCHKPTHLKEHCHWNPKNPNNKLKDKKRVLMNEVSLKTGEERVVIMKTKGKKKGNSLIYSYFICNSLKQNIYMTIPIN
jgi:hypothetical protein